METPQGKTQVKFGDRILKVVVG